MDLHNFFIDRGAVSAVFVPPPVTDEMLHVTKLSKWLDLHKGQPQNMCFFKSKAQNGKWNDPHVQVNSLYTSLHCH